MSTRVRRWNRGMSRRSLTIVSMVLLDVSSIARSSFFQVIRKNIQPSRPAARSALSCSLARLVASRGNVEPTAGEVDEEGRRPESLAFPSFPPGAESENETHENRNEQEYANDLHTIPPAERA